MEITVNVNINAPELTAALFSLANTLSNTCVPIMPATVVNETSKSEFSFNLNDANKEVATPAEKPDEKPAQKSEPVQEVKPETKPAPKEEPKPEDDKPEEDTKPEEPTYTLEQVRAKLATLSQAGKQAEVKKLITDCGVNKLTDIPVEKYAELMAAAEGL